MFWFGVFFWLHSITADRSVNYDGVTTVKGGGESQRNSSLLQIQRATLLNPCECKDGEDDASLTQPRCSKAKASCSVLRSFYTKNNNNVPSRAFSTSATVGPLWLCLRHDTIPAGGAKYGHLPSFSSCVPHSPRSLTTAAGLLLPTPL